MFKTILKTLALSAATLTLLSACGASEILRCSGLGLGEKAFDRPSCDFFTGGGAYELSYFKDQAIGGPIVDETGTATYEGIFGLYGSDTRSGGIQLIVDFDAKEISNDDNYEDSVNINGEFTERGVLTGKFSIENDGTTPADINGMVGRDAIWATFDNRSETADGYLGGFRATRLSEAVLPDGQQAGSNELDSQFTRGGFLGVGSNKPLTEEEIATYLNKEDTAKYIDIDLTGLIGGFVNVDEYEEKELTDDSNKDIDLDVTSGPVIPETPKTPVTCSDCATLSPQEFSAISAHVASIRWLSDPGTNRSRTRDSFGLRTGAGDSIIMTLNGVESVVDLLRDTQIGSRKVIYYESSDNADEIYASSNIKQILSGTHATIQGDYIRYGNVNHNINYNSQTYGLDIALGYAAIGIHTPVSVVNSQTSVATYNGIGTLFASLANSSAGGSSELDISMNVDFDANTISGSADIYGSSGIIAFNSTPIIGNEFVGSFTLNSDAIDEYYLINNPTGQYAGNFFGPNADDLAGIIQFDGIHGYAGDDVIGVGAFRADRVIGN